MRQTTFVMAKDRTPLMPTTNVKKVRKLLRSGRAEIYSYDPFTIRLLYDSQKDTQPIEITEDTGYQKIGLSVKSEKHEYVSAEYELLSDEKKRHDDRREYRRTRRNRLRYRKPRFKNRKKSEGWFAPSIQNKADRHIALIEKFTSVCPITSIVVEGGQFDTQLLVAIEKGEPIPKGEDYQHGACYGYATLREAVFQRDGYKCVCCGASGIPKNGKPGAILRMHHLGYLNHDRSNRIDNLATVCTHCHTPENHAPGGKLYELKPKLKTLKSSTFMNTVKWYIYNTLKGKFPDMVSLTYGVQTKLSRNSKNMKKSHANDAYCIGKFFPKHRANTEYFKKCRRHNRILSEFYDAIYIDKRDGSHKKGAELSNGRISRNHKLDGENLHRFRGEKIRKGRKAIRKSKPLYRQGDILAYQGKRCVCRGMKSCGKEVMLANEHGMFNLSSKKVKRLSQSHGWLKCWA